jgi:hypothetical protein
MYQPGLQQTTTSSNKVAVKSEQIGEVSRARAFQALSLMVIRISIANLVSDIVHVPARNTAQHAGELAKDFANLVGLSRSRAQFSKSSWAAIR